MMRFGSRRWYEGRLNRGILGIYPGWVSHNSALFISLLDGSELRFLRLHSRLFTSNEIGRSIKYAALSRSKSRP